MWKGEAEERAIPYEMSSVGLVVLRMGVGIGPRKEGSF